MGGNNALFFKLNQMIVNGSVSSADSLAYLSAAGSFRVQEKVAQHFGPQRVQPQDRDGLGGIFGQRILGLN